MLFLALAATGCGLSSVPAPCDGGVFLDGGCAATALREDCAPGTRPVIGAPICLPVGWTDCPPGFEADPGGLGCRDVLPASACSGASREQLGTRTCVSVGDCAAPFPPPNATHFVDAAFPTSRLDPTHFRSIKAALAEAPPGAVIAIEAGRYVENLQALRPVTLVGRCAEKVVLTSATQAYTGLYVTAVHGVEVRGLTIEKHLYGVTVFQGASVTLRDSVLDGNVSLGVYAADPGSRLTLERTVVRGTVKEAGAASGGWGLLLEAGATGELTSVALVANGQDGVFARGEGTVLSMHDSVVRDTLPDPAGAAGIGVYKGANATLERVALVANADVGLAVSSPSAGGRAPVVVASQVVVRDTVPSAIDRDPSGPVAQFLGRGIATQLGGHLELTQASLVANHEEGALAVDPGSVLTLRQVSIVDTRSNELLQLGRGVVVAHGATLDMSQCLLSGNREMSLDVAESGTTATVAGSFIGPTLGSDVGEGVGLGLLARVGATLVVTDSTIDRTAGVAVTASAAALVLSACVVSGNDVAVHTQDGTELVEVEAAPPSPAPLTFSVTHDTRFIGNVSRVGVGTMALPAAVGAH